MSMCTVWYLIPNFYIYKKLGLQLHIEYEDLEVYETKLRRCEATIDELRSKLVEMES